MQSGFTKNLRSLRRRSFLGQLVVTLLSVELLLFASFISISLPTPTQKNLQLFVQNTAVDFINKFPDEWQQRLRQNLVLPEKNAETVRYSSYVPLLPISIALAYVLNFPLALIASSLFVISGLVGPAQGFFLFANGGGGYWKEPGFGYLLGIICGAWVSSWITQDEERRSWRQLLAAVGGIGFTHLVGLTVFFGSCMSVLLFEGEAAYLQFQPYLSEQIRNLSWYTLPYDLLFATMLIALSFPLRWLFAILTSPDIANKHRPTVEAQLETLQETLA